MFKKKEMDDSKKDAMREQSVWLQKAAKALNAQRPAEAYIALSLALKEAQTTRDLLAEETALRLQNYCAWLIGDWGNISKLVSNFRRARKLELARCNANKKKQTMLAAIVPSRGVSKLENVAEPEALAGFVKIRVRAFGLNRTEIFLAHGGWPVDSLSPISPIINGIECVGEVVANGPLIDPVLYLAPGTKVLVCASSLGRGINGTHAEFVVAPRWGIVPIPVAGLGLSWRQLAAIPLSFGTAAGSLDAMDTKAGNTVLIRGGTSALGMSAICIAKHILHCHVIATTRHAYSEARLRSFGADTVLFEPNIRDQIRSLYPDGVDCALECIGETTLKDSMRCVKKRGVLCQTGALSYDPNFSLHVLGEIPPTVKVTCFESDGLMAASIAPLMEQVIIAVTQGVFKIPIEATEFNFSQYREAIKFLDADTRSGKVVVTMS